MSNFIKVFSVILIIFSLILSFYSVYATSDINMNLASNDTTANEITDDNNLLTNEDMSMQVPQDEASTGLTAPSSIGATIQEGLGVSNLLSILLITVGVILILLAIAIIIRLK